MGTNLWKEDLVSVALLSNLNSHLQKKKWFGKNLNYRSRKRKKIIIIVLDQFFSYGYGPDQSPPSKPRRGHQCVLLAAAKSSHAYLHPPVLCSSCCSMDLFTFIFIFICCLLVCFVGCCISPNSLVIWFYRGDFCNWICVGSSIFCSPYIGLR